MEYSLTQVSESCIRANRRLNPYSNGILTDTCFISMKLLQTRLNPYSNGILTDYGNFGINALLD